MLLCAQGSDATCCCAHRGLTPHVAVRTGVFTNNVYGVFFLEDEGSVEASVLSVMSTDVTGERDTPATNQQHISNKLATN
jgi:hypothetical protein